MLGAEDVHPGARRQAGGGTDVEGNGQEAEAVVEEGRVVRGGRGAEGARAVRETVAKGAQEPAVHRVHGGVARGLLHLLLARDVPVEPAVELTDRSLVRVALCPPRGGGAARVSSTSTRLRDSGAHRQLVRRSMGAQVGARPPERSRPGRRRTEQRGRGSPLRCYALPADSQAACAMGRGGPGWCESDSPAAPASATPPQRCARLRVLWQYV